MAYKEYNPLDPFADIKDTYVTKDIRTTKAYEKRRLYESLKKKKNTNEKVLTSSYYSRIIAFFRELPEREDKKKVYYKMVIGLILSVGVIFLSIYALKPFIEEQIVIKHEEAVENYHDEITAYIENREDVEPEEFSAQISQFEDELQDKLSDAEKGSEEEYLLLSSLSEIYYAKNDYDNLIYVAKMELDYDGLTVVERAKIIYDLLLIYETIGNEAGIQECLNLFYSLPDDSNVRVFEVNTIAEMKDILKERYTNE